jgi:SAM-dependent methyltransferase
MTHDRSNGYEVVAAKFMKLRSGAGTSVVAGWAASLPANARVLDIGAGFGHPITPILIEAGFDLSAIDASPAMVAAFTRNFPSLRVACETAEDSDFFGETYDAILAIGLLFLLPENIQVQLISRIAAALKPKGRFLFTAPVQACEWEDVLSRQMSYGLGMKAYEAILETSGLTPVATYTDSGGSNYYDAQKT